MRVFPRGENESLIIGDHVTVTVLEISDNRVRLGITQVGEDPEYREVELECQHEAEDASPQDFLAKAITSRRAGLLRNQRSLH